MVRHWVLIVVAASALVMSGCGSDKVTITTPSAKTSSSAASSSESSESEATSTEADAPQEPLDADACVEVTGANLDLAVASTSEEAQTAADVFDKYSPPASVQEAIDHFVQTGGAQFDDTDFEKYNTRIDDWVKEVCP